MTKEHVTNHAGDCVPMCPACREMTKAAPTSKTVTVEHEQALKWARQQNFTSVSARYAKLCAEAYDIARSAVETPAALPRIRLKDDIYDDGADHHPPGIIARKGDVLEVRELLSVGAAHPGASPGKAFIVRPGEFEEIRPVEPTENPERNSASQGYPQVDPRHEVSDSAAAKVGVAVVGSETIRSAKAGGDPWAEERKNCTCPKPGTSNSQIDPTCPISFPHPWARPEKTPANIGPREPDNDMVICPKCTSQFVAIPVNVQERLQRLNAINDNPVHYDTEVDQLTTRPWRGSPNDAVRWVCSKCRTVNANADERCCVSSCEGRRPDPWPPVTRPGRMPPWAVLLLECRDALPAISLATAKLRGLDLTLADRIEKMLEPWKVPEGKPAKYPPPSSPPAPGPDLACEGFVPDPHSQFCDKCGYPEREHRKPAAGV